MIILTNKFDSSKISNKALLIFSKIVSNGKYKSVLHRATVNEKATRISIATVYAPSLDTVVSPAPELVNLETNPPAFTGMKYREYLEMQQSNKLDGKSCLHHVRNLAV